MKYYPVYLDLCGRHAVVLGGGATALEKVRGLLDAGAQVSVVSLEPCGGLEELAAAGRISVRRRRYAPGDLEGAAIAVDASWDDATNQASAAEARARGVMLNVVDRPQYCDFIAPAVVRRGPLQVAISTSGESPFLASALKARLERSLGEEWGPFVSLVGQVRRRLRRRGVAGGAQIGIYRRLLNSNLRRLLRAGRHDQAAAAATRIAHEDQRARQGRVALVGAGPGDPDLLTLAACDLLTQADVVFHDALIAAKTLDWCGPHTRVVNVGKRGGRQSPAQEDITAQLIASAREGLDVVRLKGGDPFIFGRGGEEMAVLVAAGIEVLVIPGVSSAHAAPAVAGIPLTLRGVASSVAFLAGHETGAGRLEDLARSADTLVVLMALTNLPVLARRLARVLGPDHPAAVVSQATLPGERVVRAPLGGVAEAAVRAGLGAPATLVVGRVVDALPAAEASPVLARAFGAG